LLVPKNFKSRPTTDMIRQAAFSMLASYGVDWERGLDLFAGTGALGIEALSRGAEWVDFVDQDPRVCAIIKQNLTRLGFPDRSHVYCLTVLKALQLLQNKYDIAFLDPPYADTTLPDIIVRLDGSPLLAEGAYVVICHTSRFTPDESYGTLNLLKTRRHGDTAISIFHREEIN
jgi:16S rRNA (guanine966-N2)-methyltransferase